MTLRIAGVMFAGGVLCPFEGAAKDDAAERSDGGKE